MSYKTLRHFFGKRLMSFLFSVPTDHHDRLFHALVPIVITAPRVTWSWQYVSAVRPVKVTLMAAIIPPCTSVCQSTTLRRVAVIVHIWRTKHLVVMVDVCVTPATQTVSYKGMIPVDYGIRKKRKRSDSVLWQKPLHPQRNPKSNVTT